MTAGSLPASSRFPLHPFLVACLPVLTLWSSNADQVDPRIVLGTLLAVSILALLFLAIGRAILADWLRAGCWASFCLVIFFVHGYGLDALVGQQLSVRSPLARALPLLADLAVMGLGAWFLLRTRLRLDFLATLTTAVAAAVLAYSLVQGFMALASQPAEQRGPAVLAGPGLPSGEAVDAIGGDDAAHPDVYYVVLDGYAGESVLRDVFSFDNASFLDSLRSRGFYIAEDSRSNYSMTHLSLSSVLNAAYFDDLVPDLGPDNQSFAEPYALLRNHWVGRFFRAHGYRYAQLLSNWGGTERSEIADLAYAYVPAWLGSEFVGLLLRATPLRDFAPDVAAFHRFGLGAIREVSELAGPTFLFAHLLLPHEPYVFDRTGAVRAEVPLHLRAQRAAKDEVAAGRGDQAYAEQLAFLNQELLALVDHLLERSPHPPVIILQGDHGWASHGAEPGSPEFVEARFPILNAFYVPDSVRARLYPSISSVNTFRVLLAELFDAELASLPDRQYWSWYESPYRLRDVSEKFGAISRKELQSER